MHNKALLEQAFQQLDRELKQQEALAKKEVAKRRSWMLGTIRRELISHQRLTLKLIKTRYGM
jgi:hypothetical protein